MIIMDSFYGIEINLISSIIFAAIGFSLAKLYTWWKWRKRLKALEQTAREDEIAICVRVGGNSKPIDDVKEYIKSNHPNIKNLLLYDVSADDAKDKLADSETAQRIVEDIMEGLRAYGSGKLTRLHFFPVGMLSYVPLTVGTISNWCPIVIYHYNNGTYLTLC